MKNPTQNDKPRNIFDLLRRLLRQPLAWLVLGLVALGVAQNPQAFWDSVSALPVGLANLMPWLVGAFGLLYFVADWFFRLTVGRTLASMIDDMSSEEERKFTQNLVCAFIIATSILLLVAK